MEPKFKLNILWLKNELGIAVDQLQSEERIPLTEYFFWPKNDAWDQIRRELETKPWISTIEKGNLLNTAASF
jgi:30S ribosomal protein 3